MNFGNALSLAPDQLSRSEYVARWFFKLPFAFGIGFLSGFLVDGYTPDDSQNKQSVLRYSEMRAIISSTDQRKGNPNGFQLH